MANPIPVLFARPNKCGVPWHGLLEGPLLTLPNATTRAWPELVGHGGADLLRLPSPPSVSTTSEETAQGMEWRNHYLISGANRLFDGWEMGPNHWVYLPGFGNGYRLRIVTFTVCNGTAGGGSIGLVLGVQRMLFNGTTESERTFAVTLSNIGQYQWGGVDVLLQPTIEAQSETGTKVLIKLTRAGGSHILAACGWLELTLTGITKDTIAASLAVWKTRLQTAKSEIATCAYASDGPHTVNGQTVYYCSSNQLTRHDYVATGFYVGETLKEMKLRREWTDTRAMVAGTGFTIDHDEDATRYLIAYLDGVEVARTGLHFVGEATTNVPSSEFDTYTVTGTWTNPDGTTEDMGLSIGSWSLTGCISSTCGASTDATCSEDVVSADDYYHLKTPGLTNQQICSSTCANADPELPVVWGYAAREALASARYLGPGLVLLYGRMGPAGSPGPFETNRLIWRGISTAISAVSFTDRADVLLLRAGGQPVTGEVAMAWDGIKESTTTTGAGTLTLTALSGYSRFSDGYTVGQTVGYALVTTLNGSYAYEWGIGTVGVGNTLARNATLTRKADTGYSTSGAELDLVNPSTVYCTALDMVGYV